MSTPINLPPGFRFHPTDEELIIHYLKKKFSSSVNPIESIIADIDIYKFNPWELPDKALFGESEWFFFSPRNRKYPNGSRPNRAAGCGYWKATGTDKPILSSNGSQCIGVKKALVFHKGRPPKGSKTNWMMYEYRLLNDSGHLPRIGGSMRLDDWVLCRIRRKIDTLTQREENHKAHKRSLSPCDYGNFEEKDIIEKINYFKNYELTPQEGEVVDEQNGYIQEGYMGHSFSDANSDFQKPMVHSMEDALETIKRVLSIGALDELVQMPPNKRLCSFDYSSNLGGKGSF